MIHLSKFNIAQILDKFAIIDLLQTMMKTLYCFTKNFKILLNQSNLFFI